MQFAVGNTLLTVSLCTVIIKTRSSNSLEGVQVMSKRVLSLDLLRIVATFSVVFFHVIRVCTANAPTLSPAADRLLFSLSDMLQWQVPVFFLLTGYLWLGSGKKCTWRDMQHNLLRFVLILFTVGFTYAGMERFFHSRSLSLSLVLGALSDVCTGNLWDHMWFLYTIIGVYLLLPVMKPFFEGSVRNGAVLVCILWFFVIAVPMFETFFGYTFPVEVPASSALLYVCTGGLLSKLHFGRKTSLVMAVAFCCSCVALFFSRLYAFFGVSDFWIYTSAVSLFCAAICSLDNRFSPKWIQELSKCTFGIYVLHPFFINLIAKLFGFYPTSFLPIITIPGLSIAIFAISFLTTFLLRRIPPVKKYLF